MMHEKQSLAIISLRSLVISLAILIFCFPTSKSESLAKEEKSIIINIFVHGVCNIESHCFKPKEIINFFKDDIYNTYYEHNLKLFRQERSFYQFQAMQDLGLHEVTDRSVTPGNASGALVNILEQTFTHICPENKVPQRYYTYGWSGLHSVKEYCAMGKNLYENIVALKKELVAQGYDPILRVWGYSHGGNVALMMAHHYRSHTKRIINELILLGTPFISNSTVELIASPLFKRVYNIYSLCDKVQRYDLIHLNAFWCEQKLTAKTLKTLPKNLVQVRLRYTLPSKQAQQNRKSFIHSKNFTKKSILTGKSRLLKNVSPGHIELWLFGWTFNHYRPDFITYPLPAGAFSIPYALHHLNDIVQEKSHNPAEEFIIDVRPYHELVLINQKTKRSGTVNKIVAPFFPMSEFTSMKEQGKLYNPTDLSYESYCEKLALIDTQALATFNKSMSNMA